MWGKPAEAYMMQYGPDMGAWWWWGWGVRQLMSRKAYLSSQGHEGYEGV